MVDKFCFIILLRIAFVRCVPKVAILVWSAVVVIVAAVFGLIVLPVLMWLLGRIIPVWTFSPLVLGFFAFVNGLFFSDPGFLFVGAMGVLIGALLRFFAVGVSNWPFFLRLVNIFFGFLVRVSLFLWSLSILRVSHRLFTLILCPLVIPIMIVGLSRLRNDFFVLFLVSFLLRKVPQQKYPQNQTHNYEDHPEDT